MRSLSRLAVTLFLAIVSTASSLDAQTAKGTSRVDLFVTFGDSLSDTGNLYTMTKAMGLVPAIPPSDSPHRTYFEGRFSNGRLGFEHLWDRLRGYSAPLQPVLTLGYVPNKGAVDFSFGGATSGHLSQTPGGTYVPGLLGQVDLFLTLRKSRVPARTIAAIVAGSNDYLTTPPTLPANPVEVVENITAAIRQLHARGVGTVMVLNVPDLGTVPLMAPRSDEDRTALSTLSAAHNYLLAGALGALGAELPSLTIIPIDVAAVVATIPPTMNASVPAVAALIAGATNDELAGRAAAACLFTDPTTCVNVPSFEVGSAFFYWDVLHPTAAVHQALGVYMCSQLPGCVPQ